MTKYLLVIAVALAVIWLLRADRRRAQEPPHAKPGKSPQAMVRCDWCAIHLPQSDAVDGQHGRYCCSEHKQKAES